MKLHSKLVLGFFASALGVSLIACSGSDSKNDANSGSGGSGNTGTGGSNSTTGGSDSTGTAGTSSGTSGSNSSGTGGSAGGTTTVPAFDAVDLIADFETPCGCDAGPGILMNGGRIGGWYTYDDGSLDVDGGMPKAGKLLIGMGLEEANVPDPGGNGHDTFMGQVSLKALHVHGGPYSGSYGSGFGTDLASGMAYDGSGNSGIVFWAKNVGGAMDLTTIRVSISTADTEEPPKGNGKCTPGMKMVDCDDDFGSNITLTSDWKAYVIHFADKTWAQEGWGYKPAGGFDASKMFGLKFKETKGKAFDFYIDDIAFIKK